MWQATQAAFVIVIGLAFMGALLSGFFPRNHYEWPGDERGEPFHDDSTEKEEQ